jgi:predicted RNase H-like HicB family nuclease
VPGANGQGETIEETKNSLREAIQLILEDRKRAIGKEDFKESSCRMMGSFFRIATNRFYAR